MRPWRLPTLFVLCAVWLAFADVALARDVPNVVADETASSAKIWVYFGDGCAASRAYTYRTEDGSATAGEDYESVTGQSTGNPSGGSFEVPLIDEKIKEGDETVRVIVAFPPNDVAVAGCGNREWEIIEATLTILDDETPRPASSPGVTSSGSVGPGGVASGSVGAGASASEQSSGGPATPLAAGLSALGPRVTADITEIGEAQGVASRSASQTESSSSYPIPLIALGTALLIMGAALSTYLLRRVRLRL